MEKSINQNSEKSKEDLENNSQQLNPNNEKYWKARGLVKRPKEWKEKDEKEKK